MLEAINRPKYQTCLVEEKKSWNRVSKGYQRRGDKAVTGRVHTGSPVYHVVGKCGVGKEVNRWMKDVHELHRLE